MTCSLFFSLLLSVAAWTVLNRGVGRCDLASEPANRPIAARARPLIPRSNENCAHRTSLLAADGRRPSPTQDGRLLPRRTAEPGRLDGALVSLRTKPRVISPMRLHIKDRDSAHRPWQVRRFAWRRPGQSDFTIARSARRRALTRGVVSPRHDRCPGRSKG